jgi:signal transduction histidine kinase
MTVVNLFLQNIISEQLFRISNFSSAILLFCIAYAIVRYRLMDITVIIKRGLIFSILIGLIALIFASGASFLSPYLPSWATGLILAIVITAIFVPFKNFLEIATDRIFFKKQYQFSEAVSGLNHILLGKTDIAVLTEELLAFIADTLKISRGAILLCDHQGEFEVKARINGDKAKIVMERTSAIVKYLSQLKTEMSHDKMLEILEKDELAYLISNNALNRKYASLLTEAADELNRLNFQAAIPCFSKNDTTGIILLGGRNSGEPFTKKDMQLLDVILHEASLALENVVNIEHLKELDQAKTDFIRVISHQLRTPLGVGRWNFELLMDEASGKMPKKLRSIVKEGYESILRLNRGVNTFINVLELEEKTVKMSLSRIDFNSDIVDEAVAGIEERVKDKKLQIERTLAFNTNLFADQSKLKIAVETLLDNAVNYSPEGGTITIGSKLEKKKNFDDFIFWVEDGGIGIAPQITGYIFNKFFRGEEAKNISPDGFGLGLYLARNYVELHGGQLWLGKKTTPGAIFYISIPIKNKTAGIAS